MEYKPTIGLEIHAELKTQTKMFCDSPNAPFASDPNTNICPVCMGYPGTLPVINKEAVKHVLKVGLVVGGKLADFTEFDRKNYFYPDIPKGYQLSQYKYPLISGGNLSGVELTRIHLEEDTASSTHHDNYSLIDFNRTGVPLMELVTEPVIKSGQEAGKFGRELQLILRYLGAGEANMEKGEMRVEANISVSKTDEFGTKVEVKNLNSFKSVEKAIDFEIARQIEELEGGGEVIQETRGWDENKQETFSQRKKETSEDYRYFPDPDLPKLIISEIPDFAEDVLRSELPELPSQKRERYQKDYGIKDEDIDMYVQDIAVANFFEKVSNSLGGDREKIKLASNYITSDLQSLNTDWIITLKHKDFADLIMMIDNGKLSSRGAKDALKIMVEEGDAPSDIIEKHGLAQQSDESALSDVADAIIAANPEVVAEYKQGKETALKYLIGQAMKETKGAANPQVLHKLLTGKLS